MARPMLMRLSEIIAEADPTLQKKGEREDPPLAPCPPFLADFFFCGTGAGKRGGREREKKQHGGRRKREDKANLLSSRLFFRLEKEKGKKEKKGGPGARDASSSSKRRHGLTLLPYKEGRNEKEEGGGEGTIAKRLLSRHVTITSLPDTFTLPCRSPWRGKKEGEREGREAATGSRLSRLIGLFRCAVAPGKGINLGGGGRGRKRGRKGSDGLPKFSWNLAFIDCRLAGHELKGKKKKGGGGEGVSEAKVRSLQWLSFDRSPTRAREGNGERAT